MVLLVDTRVSMSTTSLDGVRDDVNKVKTRFNELQTEIKARLDESSKCMETVEALHRDVAKKSVTAENDLAVALKNEKDWIDIKARLAKPANKGMIVLDVGGCKYTTSVETLSQEKNTFFTALFSEQWTLDQDPSDKSILIDRNPKLFSHIVEYLRNSAVPIEVMKSESLRRSLLIEAEYFRLQNLIVKLKPAFPDGTLLETQQMAKLNEFYGKEDQRWTLIHKASKDGFDAASFHTHCNNQAPTMTIIRSNNNCLFGGYTAVPWTSDGTYKNDATAFLFTLTNPHNIPPTKYLVTASSAASAVMHNATHGPYFGNSALHVSDGSNASNSNIGFPNVYTDSTGKGNATFTGAAAFLVFDMEVFKLA